MAIYAHKSKPFVPAPAGVHRAVCVDVVDLGIQKTQFGDRETIRFAWQIEPRMSNGKPFVVTRTYTNSTHEKANLGKDLRAWLDEGEDLGLDLETLIGRGCRLWIQHSTGKDGETYANVEAVMADDTGGAPLKAEDYTRKRDRKEAS